VHYDEAQLRSIVSSQDINPTFSVITNDNGNNTSISLTRKLSCYRHEKGFTTNFAKKCIVIVHISLYKLSIL